jgi:hypothetical protein
MTHSAEVHSNVDTIYKIIMGSTISSLSSERQCISEEAQFFLPPLPEERLRNMVSVRIREE